MTDASPPRITSAALAAVEQERQHVGPGTIPIAVHQGDTLTWATVHQGVIVGWQTESPVDRETAYRLAHGRLHVIDGDGA
jgi:hypothetical protein